jgi:hypothetical protein
MVSLSFRTLLWSSCHPNLEEKNGNTYLHMLVLWRHIRSKKTLHCRPLCGIPPSCSSQPVQNIPMEHVWNSSSRQFAACSSQDRKRETSASEQPSCHENNKYLVAGILHRREKKTYQGLAAAREEVPRTSVVACKAPTPSNKAFSMLSPTTTATLAFICRQSKMQQLVYSSP